LDYTGVSPSSTLDTISANSLSNSTSTYISSGYVNTTFPYDLYVTVSGGNDCFMPSLSGSPQFTAEALTQPGCTTYTAPGLMMADYVALGPQYLQSTFTSGGNGGSAILAAFHSAIVQSYPPLGVLDSATFDTRSPSQLNSLVWRGTVPSGTSVNFQIAVSNSSNGPWNFVGPDGTGNTVYSGSPGTPIPFQSCSLYSSCYLLFSNYRYFRYRVNLLSNGLYTPTVTSVVVNWSL